jgi:hypothetical protein
MVDWGRAGKDLFMNILKTEMTWEIKKKTLDSFVRAILDFHF